MPVRSWTDEELLGLESQVDGKWELVDGEIVVSPAGGRHGRVIVRLTARLHLFVEARGLGEVLDSSTGFRLPGGNLRSPDVSFIAAHRLPEGGVPRGFLHVAPDLAVEVLSPEDEPRKVMDKIREYATAGVVLVWVIDPEKETAVAYRAQAEGRQVLRDQSLDGEDVVPGFTCPLAQLFG